MKFGVADYGMSVWYGGNFDYLGRFEDLKSIGYDGVEQLQCPNAAEAIERAAMVHRMGMDFATCNSPSPDQTIKFASALGKEYVWLVPGSLARTQSYEEFFRHARGFTDICKKFGLLAALHNHLGIRVETQEELEMYMDQCPESQLLLDIGHLFGAGGDILRTIDKYHDRIASVHFKDIFIKDASITEHDRWPERFRFCEIGGGNAGVPWKEAAELLKKYHYDKWVLVEHDTHLQDPLIDLKKSLENLKNIFC